MIIAYGEANKATWTLDAQADIRTLVITDNDKKKEELKFKLDEYSIYLENRVRHKESCDGQRREQSYLYTGQIFTCSGINFDFVSLVYEQRNAYGSTSLNGSRFGSTLCGISLEAGLCLCDHKLYE